MCGGWVRKKINGGSVFFFGGMFLFGEVDVIVFVRRC